MNKQSYSKDPTSDLKKAKPTKSGKVGFIVLISIALVITGIVTVSLLKKPSNAKATSNVSSQVKLSQPGDLVIPISGISEKATFYPMTVDGIKLEVLAVKAPDKSIRTAFNTCQVCFDSGKGYYKQEGDVLVCQNCGNRFKMSQVEITKGGCNPVPIYDKDITMDQSNITISADYLKQTTKIFKNWKTA